MNTRHSLKGSHSQHCLSDQIAANTTKNIPFRTRRSSTRGTPRGLFGSSGAITPHSKSVSSYPRMIQLPQLGSDERVSVFLDRSLDGEWPYLWLDATYLKVRDGGPHRLGSSNNRRGSEHRGPARDRR